MELFSQATQSHTQPLAHRMRPRTLDEYIGQDHIIGSGRLLRRAIQADQLTSVIFYGPPGTGKTTLARVIANTTKSRFITMNAVLSGVKDLREEIKSAKDRLDLHGTRTILFVDEVHRWNKSQQDALLPWVENGTVILIGATTENPYFEVNSALVSRSRIFQLKKLTSSDLDRIAEQALNDKDRGYGNFTIEFEEGALKHLVEIANGDARSLLNALQLAVETTPDKFPPEKGSSIYITQNAAEESIQRKVVLYDKEGDYHFDVISAFIKSIRGSDPDAVLYWLARMVRAGEDPRYIFRRMLISASEDIGLADPAALRIVGSAAAAFDRIGLPEGRFHLAQAALYLATAEKSNSTMGFFDALRTIEQEEDSEVPNHLKDASRDKKGFGHGEGYLYPHAYNDHWVAQQYLPTGLQGKIFYNPSAMGYEQGLREKVIRNREAQLEASSLSHSAEILTFSPPDRQKDLWLQRLVSGRGTRLAGIREKVFSRIEPERHDRILVLNTSTGMLVWEACRRVPEGGVFGFTESKEHALAIQNYAERLPEAEKPVILHGAMEECFSLLKDDISFEFMIGMDLLSRLSERSGILPIIYRMGSPGSSLILAETIPSLSTRLSSLVSEKDAELGILLEKAEHVIFSSSNDPLVNWDEKDLVTAIEQAGFSVLHREPQVFQEQRTIFPKDISRWVNKKYYPALTASTEADEQETGKSAIPSEEEIVDRMSRLLTVSPQPWETVVFIVQAMKNL